MDMWCRCDVTVWNWTKSKCDPLISLAAKYVRDKDLYEQFFSPFSMSLNKFNEGKYVMLLVIARPFFWLFKAYIAPVSVLQIVSHIILSNLL